MSTVPGKNRSNSAMTASKAVIIILILTAIVFSKLEFFLPNIRIMAGTSVMTITAMVRVLKPAMLKRNSPKCVL